MSWTKSTAAVFVGNLLTLAAVGEGVRRIYVKVKKNHRPRRRTRKRDSAAHLPPWRG